MDMINQLVAAGENHPLLYKLKTYQQPDLLVCDEIGYLGRLANRAQTCSSR
jgi:hypothetical protein